MAKITQAQVYIIGAVLTVITAALIYFLLIKPSMESLAEQTAKYEQRKAVADKMDGAKKARKTAETQIAAAKADWAIYDRQLMPNIDISNLIIGQKQLWNEQIVVLVPKVEKFLQADKSVQVVSAAITAPTPSGDPNTVNKKQFTYDLGTVSVAGTFPAILKHAERWNRFDRLIMVTGLTLSGNSPRLVGTYSLRCFEFTHGEKPGDPIPQASPSTGGGFGGPPAGFGGPGGGGPPPGYGNGPGADAAGAPGAQPNL